MRIYHERQLEDTPPRAPGIRRIALPIRGFTSCMFRGKGVICSRCGHGRGEHGENQSRQSVRGSGR